VDRRGVSGGGRAWDPSWTPVGPQLDPSRTPVGPQSDPSWDPAAPRLPSEMGLGGSLTAGAVREGRCDGPRGAPSAPWGVRSGPEELLPQRDGRKPSAGSPGCGRGGAVCASQTRTPPRECPIRATGRARTPRG